MAKGGADREVPGGFGGELLQDLDRQRTRNATYFLESQYLCRLGRYRETTLPHLFRHQLLTYLTREGLLDANCSG